MAEGAAVLLYIECCKDPWVCTTLNLEAKRFPVSSYSSSALNVSNTRLSASR